MNEIDVNDFICPISQDLMKNPYIGPEGVNIDFDSIKKCIEMNGKSPFSREDVSLNQYNPNRLLKSRIEDFKKRLGEEIILYTPKLRVQKFSKNKLINKDLNLLGDYLFCFHKNLREFNRGFKM